MSIRMTRRLLLEVGWYALLACVVAWNIVIGLVILNADTRRQEAVEETKDDNQRQTEALCLLITEQSPKSLTKLDFDTQERCREVADNVRNKREERSSQHHAPNAPSTAQGKDTQGNPQTQPRGPRNSSDSKPDAKPTPKPEEPEDDFNLPLLGEGIEDRIGL